MGRCRQRSQEEIPIYLLSVPVYRDPETANTAYRGLPQGESLFFCLWGSLGPISLQIGVYGVQGMRKGPRPRIDGPRA
jgi:hypothetical protein